MAEIGIFVGTMYGNSLLVAEEAEAILARQGHSATVFEDPELSDWQQYQDKVALVVTSTTGQGDLPDSIAPLFHGIKDTVGFQPNLRYGVIALGDSSYPNFCNGGKQFDACCRSKARSGWGRCYSLTPANIRSRRANPIPGLKTGELYFPEVNPSPLRRVPFRLLALPVSKITTCTQCKVTESC